MLKEELLDLSGQHCEEISLLRYTPAAGSIGTCRYKLKPDQQEDFDRCLDVFRAHDVGYFIYIGGNDSMDTANKIALLAEQRGLPLVGIGGPKTIDNDLCVTDHCPGYGSAARFVASAVMGDNEDNRSLGGVKIDVAEEDAIAKAALEPLERDGDGENPYEIQRDLQEMMQDKVGIIREEGLMKEAIDDLAALAERAPKAAAPGNREYNPGWHTALDLKLSLIHI